MSQDTVNTETVLTKKQLDKVSGGMRCGEDPSTWSPTKINDEKNSAGLLGENGHGLPPKHPICGADPSTWSPTQMGDNGDISSNQ